jgi:lysophospholipase L1-like esterase
MGTLLLILLALYGTIAGAPHAHGPKEASRGARAAVPEAEGEAPAVATGGTSSGRVLVVGDSLAVGTQAPLAQLLPGWRIVTSAHTDRHTADGVAEIVSRGSLPGVIVVSLGTNDNPSETARFAGEVEAVMDAAGPSRCVIWANIARPPYAGVSYAGYNRVLTRLSLSRPNLVVADWAGIARSQPGVLGSDGVHATASGYAIRAQAIAGAIASCSGVRAYGGASAGAVGD